MDDSVGRCLGRIRVLPVTDQNSAFVEWTSSWQTRQGDVEEFCNPNHEALFNDLQADFV